MDKNAAPAPTTVAGTLDLLQEMAGKHGWHERSYTPGPTVGHLEFHQVSRGFDLKVEGFSETFRVIYPLFEEGHDNMKCVMVAVAPGLVLQATQYIGPEGLSNEDSVPHISVFAVAAGTEDVHADAISRVNAMEAVGNSSHCPVLPFATDVLLASLEERLEGKHEYYEENITPRDIAAIRALAPRLERVLTTIRKLP